MIRRRLFGLDLNGVDDRLAVLESEGLPECVDLGVRGSLVHLLAQKRWVAGRQSETAPHGRGPAWGEIGSAEHRVELLALFKRLRTAEAVEWERRAFASALPGLTVGGERAVFAAPDVPEWGEAFRNRYLQLLSYARGPRPLLLWRPVAALLGRIADCPDGMDAGKKVAVLSLMADGAHLALLAVEREKGASLPVPVRRQTGVAAGASFRGERLINDARQRLSEKSGLPEDDIRASAWAPWRCAIGAKPTRELLRLAQNRGWKALPDLQQRPLTPDWKDAPEELLFLLGQAELLLVEGPFASNAAWRDAVLATLRQRMAMPAQIEYLEAPTVALGCLEAARRDRAGQAIYFDFLPQLEINALVENRPKFVDLIASGKRCQGGQIFRAPAPGRYAINPGANRFTFWLFKEDFVHGRKAEVPLPEIADRRYVLTVEVSQTPGQGFAEVTISSTEFDALRRQPIHLNWEDMIKVPDTQEQILQEMDKLSGANSWPETAVKMGHPIHWHEERSDVDLLALLVAYQQNPLVSNDIIHKPTWELLKKLRKRFSLLKSPSFLGKGLGLSVNKQESRRALNSDGTLPEPVDNIAVPAGAERELDRTLEKLEQDLMALKQAFGPTVKQDVLGDVVGFASWCFWRCPSRIADLLLDIYADHQPYKVHPTLLREGVARIAANREGRLERYFAAVKQKIKGGQGITTPDFAGLARALGTVPQAANVLDGQLADFLLEEARTALEEENIKQKDRAYKRRFGSAILMLAALLRRRKTCNNFLDPESSKGKQFLSLLMEAKERNLEFAMENQAAQGRDKAKKHAAAKRMIRNIELLTDLKDFIRLQGTNPSLIEQIQAMPDD